MAPNIVDIGGILVSSDLFTTFFQCDLATCKGACCIEGESGAPISDVEEKQMKVAYPDIKDLLTSGAKETVDLEGFSYLDSDGDRVTTLYQGGACAFVTFMDCGSARCAFEKGYTEGYNHTFYKPLSCHLYPIRVASVGDNIALNYHRWKPICEPARKLGKENDMRLYRFLEQPLVRAFGKEWYDELLTVADFYLKTYL